MTSLFRRALRDLGANRFLNLVTAATVALAVLIFSAFALFLLNADGMIRAWMRDMRVMAYLAPDTAPGAVQRLHRRIAGLEDVRSVRFVSREAALARFRKQLGPQASLLDGLAENPLPDAFEVYLTVSPRTWERVAPVAETVAELPGIAEVEYGREWLGRAMGIVSLFRLSAYAMGGLFFLATLFFVANTIRLALHSRRHEIEVMRLVGATDGFIKDPIYVGGLLLGAAGGGVGLAALYGLFRFLTAHLDAGLLSPTFSVRFLPPRAALGILAGSAFVGWLGCFLSLKQFLKT
jgi:cell division transport system permease protein